MFTKEAIDALFENEHFQQRLNEHIKNHLDVEVSVDECLGSLTVKVALRINEGTSVGRDFASSSDSATVVQTSY